MPSTSPKVVVIGAGSLFFGRQALYAMIQSPTLRHGTLAYVDVDESRLERMVALACKAIAHAKIPLTVQGSIDRRAMLPGADFVVLSFAKDGVRYRGVDCAIALRHGVRMCSGDTIGPGGVFRAMRELPNIMAVADDVRRLCPNAWIINYINPSAINGIGLRTYAPDLKSFALCDTLHMPHVKRHYLRKAGFEVTPDQERRFDCRIAGVNHFTWLMSATYDGADVTGRIRESLRAEAAAETNSGHAKARFNATYALRLWDIFGLLPACISHTKEYVRYWQGLGMSSDGLPPLSIFDHEARQTLHDAMWKQVDGYLSGALPMDHFFTTQRSDHATDVIEAMWSKSGRPFHINTANRGAVPNLPDDAFLEVLCDVDMEGPRPRACGDFPRGLRSLQMQVLDAHELTADGICRKDRDSLLRALCTDPLANSISDAEEMLDECLALERDALPAHWYGAAARIAAMPG